MSILPMCVSATSTLYRVLSFLYPEPRRSHEMLCVPQSVEVELYLRFSA